jgi:hypothetical protein
MTGNPEVMLLCSVKSDFRNVRHPHLRLTPSVVLMVTWAEVCSTGIMLRSRYCNQSEVGMEYDEDKVDEMVLALLELTTFKEGMGIRASKGMTGTLWIAFTRGGTFPILRTQQSP